MQKQFHFDSPPGLYRADACVVACFDARFDLALRKFLKRRGVIWADQVRVAGGAKCLASPQNEAERDFALRQIDLSVRLHAADRVLLFMHSDCGAYQGLAAFGGDAEVESAHHQQELARAAACLRARIPAVAVECYFVNFDGVWQS